MVLTGGSDEAGCGLDHRPLVLNGSAPFQLRKYKPEAQASESVYCSSLRTSSTGFYLNTLACFH